MDGRPWICATTRPIARGCRWLPVDEISVHLGVSRDTIYKWIDRKGMPAHRVGRLWKFKKAEIDDWVRAGGGTESKPAGTNGEEPQD